MENEQFENFVRLAKRVANLNEHAGEIGPGMLAMLVDEARTALEEIEESW